MFSTHPLQKDPHQGSDADTTATLNTTSLTLGENQAPLTSPVSRHGPLDITLNQERVPHPSHVTAQSDQNSQQLYDPGCPPERSQQHSSYNDIEYYDYSEENCLLA